MEVAIILALAAVLGFILGLVVGARYALDLVMSGRAVRTARARLARGTSDVMPQRSAADILAGVVRVWLGNTEYVLPVLPRAAARRWLETLDLRFAAVASAVNAAGDDTPEIMSFLVGEADGMYDLLLSYDQSGVLPSRDEIDETATDAQVLAAVLEVWRAVNPKAASPSGSASTMSGSSSGPSSSRPSSTAGLANTSTSA